MELNAYQRLLKNPQLVPIVTHINALHALPSYFFMIRCNNILTSTLRSFTKWTFKIIILEGAFILFFQRTVCSDSMKGSTCCGCWLGTAETILYRDSLYTLYSSPSDNTLCHVGSFVFPNGACLPVAFAELFQVRYRTRLRWLFCINDDALCLCVYS